jgi:hypothetical protein
MTLPVINTPTFVLELPSTKQKVTFRPFLVKEEKILLIALQDKKQETIINAIKQIIVNCTFGKLDTSKLTTFDLEYIFLQLRIKSKGSEVELSFVCNNEKDGQRCGQENGLKYDLGNIKIVTPEGHTDKIMLTDSICVVMKHPTLNDMAKIQSIVEKDDIAAIYDIIYDFVDTIAEGDTIYSFTREELAVFIESLSEQQFNKLRGFFDTMPKLVGSIPIKCKKCGHQETIELEGLQSFLA